MLSAAEKLALEARIAALEAHTGAQVVTAVVGRADAYPEAPWTAFALATALAALAVVVLDLLRPDWMGTYVALAHVLPVLGAGGLAALAAVLVPEFGRLFVRGARRAVRVRRYAQCLFFERNLARTRARTAVLLLVARFERRVELIADSGYAGHVDAADWRAVVDAATARLARGDGAEALGAALDRLEALLVARGYRAATRSGDRLQGDERSDNELPDAPIEAPGP